MVAGAPRSGLGKSVLTTAEKAKAFDQSLGEFLVRQGKLDAAGLERARRLSESQGGRVDQVLIKLGLVSEQDMAEAFAAELDLPLALAGDFPDAPVLPNKVSIKFLKEARRYAGGPGAGDGRSAGFLRRPGDADHRR